MKPNLLEWQALVARANKNLETHEKRLETHIKTWWTIAALDGKPGVDKEAFDALYAELKRRTEEAAAYREKAFVFRENLTKLVWKVEDDVWDTTL